MHGRKLYYAECHEKYATLYSVLENYRASLTSATTIVLCHVQPAQASTTSPRFTPRHSPKHSLFVLMITLCSTINVVAVEEWSKLSLLFYNWSYTFVTELPPYSASPSTPNAAIASFLDRLSLAWHSHNTRKTKFALMTLQLSSLVAEACCLSLFQAKARMPYCILSNTCLRFSCSKD